MHDDDLLDIQAALAGDGEAYQRLVRRHEPKVAAQMWRFSRDPRVCEELVQDTFVQAYFSLRSYRGRARFAHWLTRIATRVGYGYWKKKSREKVHLPLEAFDRAAPQNDALDPSTAASILQRLLGHLRRADRLVMALFYFEECSTEEIAERMGCSRPVVKMRMHRARKKLRKIAKRDSLWEKLGWTE